MASVMQQMLMASSSGAHLTPASYAYQAAYTPTVSGGVATQTNVAFGATGSNRLVIIAVQWAATVSTSVLSSAIIGGVSVPTIITGTRLGPNVSSVWFYTALIAAFVPTGTTGTVVATLTGGGAPDVRFFSYQALNILSATPYATAQNSSTTSPVSTTCNLQAGGVVFAAGTDLAASTLTWTGVTKAYDMSPGSGEFSGGAALTPSLVTGSSFQFTDAGGTSGSPTRSILVASFR